ncbi:lipase family protein [Hyphomonas beringensis]|nr:lipase family protein [Hyphomonas beringensis]
MSMSTRAISLIASLLLGSGCATAQLDSAVPYDGRVSEFYSWEESVPEMPGEMLRKAPLADALSVPGAARAERILYSSTNGIDDRTPVVVSAALFYPQGDMPEGGWPVIAWGHGTKGVADICAPSWTGMTYRDRTYLSKWLSEGFAIVASDYQGLGTAGPHPYIAGRAAGYSILDSARAVTRFTPELSNKVLLMGQSQGGGAVTIAAAYAPEYAPELNIIGVVTTGAGIIDLEGPDLLGDSEAKIDPTSAYALYVVRALSLLDPKLRPEDMLTPKAMTVLPLADTRCVADLEYDVTIAELNWSKTLKPYALQVIKEHIDFLNPPETGYAAPFFMGTGADDIDVAPEFQEDLAHTICRTGVSVQHHVYKGEDHSTALNASLEDSIPFVRRLMVGGAVESTCGSGE